MGPCIVVLNNLGMDTYTKRKKMKRTQANKLDAVLKVGLLEYVEQVGDKKKYQFTPTEEGYEKYGIEPVSKIAYSPFELVDLIYFHYLQNPKRNGMQNRE